MSAEEAMSLDAACESVQAIGAAAVAQNPAVMVLCHGGPIATPEDAASVMSRTGAVGFVGASSMERLPVETAHSQTTEQFKAIPIGLTQSTP
jgi:predicted TIM-barrel enzyme